MLSDQLADEGELARARDRPEREVRDTTIERVVAAAEARPQRAAPGMRPGSG